MCSCLPSKELLLFVQSKFRINERVEGLVLAKLEDVLSHYYRPSMITQLGNNKAFFCIQAHNVFHTENSSFQKQDHLLPFLSKIFV